MKIFIAGHVKEPERNRLEEILLGLPGLSDEAEAYHEDGGLIYFSDTAAPAKVQGQEKKRILVVEPHPDDGILSMGGLICRHHAEGSALFSHIVFSEEGEMGAVRQEESRFVWETVLGGHIRSAGLPDQGMEQGGKGIYQTGRAYKTILKLCMEGIEQAVSEISPHIVYFPVGIGEHFHHTIVNAGTDFVIPHHPQIDFRFYEDYPYSDFSRITYSRPLYRITKRCRLQKLYVPYDPYRADKANLVLAYHSQVKQKYSELQNALDTYGRAVGYEGLIEQHGPFSGMVCERVWRLVR